MCRVRRARTLDWASRARRAGGALTALLLVAASCDKRTLSASADEVPPPDHHANPTGSVGANDATATGHRSPDAPSRRLFHLVTDMEQGAGSPFGTVAWTAHGSSGSTPTGSGGGLVDIDPPRGDSTRAGYVNTPAGSRIDLRMDVACRSRAGTTTPCDFSTYVGVAFWARASSEGETFLFAMEDDLSLGLRSYLDARVSTQPWFEAPVTLSSRWRRHVILFDDLAQPGAVRRPLRSEAVATIHFMGGGFWGSRELWIDDVALLCRGFCPDTPSSPDGDAASALEEDGLVWIGAGSGNAGARCAEIALLSMTAPEELRVAMTEQTLLRARVPGVSPMRLARWSWRARHLGSGGFAKVTAIDEAASTVALAITRPGEYSITAATDVPGQGTCGVEVRGSATR